MKSPAMALLDKIAADTRRALNELRREGGEPLIEPALELASALIARLLEIQEIQPKSPTP